MAEHQTENLIMNMSREFALDIIKFVEVLESQKRYPVANQLLRCGTSIGANVHEAQNSESKTDFIHKLKIAAKESAETDYWLYLCDRSDEYPSPPAELLDKRKQIDKILGKIISTAKRNLNSTR